MKAIKFLEGNIGENLHDLETGKGFLDMTLRAQATLDQNFKLLCFKGHHQESEKTTHRKGENICKSYIC